MNKSDFKKNYPKIFNFIIDLQDKKNKIKSIIFYNNNDTYLKKQLNKNIIISKIRDTDTYIATDPKNAMSIKIKKILSIDNTVIYKTTEKDYIKFFDIKIISGGNIDEIDEYSIYSILNEDQKKYIIGDPKFDRLFLGYRINSGNLVDNKLTSCKCMLDMMKEASLNKNHEDHIKLMNEIMLNNLKKVNKRKKLIHKKYNECINTLNIDGGDLSNKTNIIKASDNIDKIFKDISDAIGNDKDETIIRNYLYKNYIDLPKKDFIDILSKNTNIAASEFVKELFKIYPQVKCIIKDGKINKIELSQSKIISNITDENDNFILTINLPLLINKLENEENKYNQDFSIEQKNNVLTTTLSIEKKKDFNKEESSLDSSIISDSSIYSDYSMSSELSESSDNREYKSLKNIKGAGYDMNADIDAIPTSLIDTSISLLNNKKNKHFDINKLSAFDN